MKVMFEKYILCQAFLYLTAGSPAALLCMTSYAVLHAVDVGNLFVVLY